MKLLRRENLISASFIFYMLCLTYPLLIGNSVYDLINPPPIIRLMQILGVLSFILIMTSSCGFILLRELYSNQWNRTKFIVIVFLLTLLGAFFGEDALLSLIYTLLTMAVFLLVAPLWSLPDIKRNRMFLCTGLMIFLFYIVAVFLKGFDSYGGRMIGMIHPNLMGLCAFVALVSYCLGTQKGRVFAFIFALVIALSVSSRVSMIAVTMFFLCLMGLDMLKNKSLQKLILLSSTFVVVMGTFLLLILIGQDHIVTDFFVESLKLNSVSRGLDSGFTGRSYLWNKGVDAIIQNPLGYGFRASKELGAHSGYLNLLIDAGLISGVLLIVFAIYATAVSGVKFLKPYNAYEEDRALVVFSALLTYLFAWIFEPAHYFIGHPYSLLCMVLLMSPFVSKQATSKRLS